MGSILIWSIASIWLTGYQDTVMIGEFKTQQSCLTALKKHRPNWGIEPSAIQCIQVRQDDLHAMKEHERTQSWLGVQR